MPIRSLYPKWVLASYRRDRAASRIQGSRGGLPGHAEPRPSSTLAGVERVWRAIESGVFYPAPSTMSCSSCGYREACRAWMG
jgi:hypothetical protein